MKYLLVVQCVVYAECTCGRGGESYALCAMLSFECSILNYYGLNKICLANNVDKAESRHNIQASLILVINKASLFITRKWMK